MNNYNNYNILNFIKFKIHNKFYNNIMNSINKNKKIFYNIHNKLINYKLKLN